METATQEFETQSTIASFEVKRFSAEDEDEMALEVAREVTQTVTSSVTQSLSSSVTSSVTSTVMREMEVTARATPNIEMRNQQPKRHSRMETTLRQHFGQRVVDLIYWRDVKKSAVVVSSSLFLLISLSIFSVLSVISYISLAALTVTFSFSVYKRTLAAVQKTNDGHPFGRYLEMDLSIPPEKAQEYAEVLSSYTATYVGELRRLLLVEDLVDSIKFGIFLWVMTYLGAWFNGLTLLILGLVAMFSLPKTYEVYHEQIDAYLVLAQDKVKGVMAQMREQLPKDFEETKAVILKFCNSIVQMVQAKIPIGKKDQ